MIMMMRQHKSPNRAGSNRTEEKILLGSNGSNDSDDDSDEEGDYERAVAATGYGRFHYALLMVCGWANASDAIEIICISFLLPSAECDLELTEVRKGWLSAILFVGMMIGGYFWGSLGDSIGRRGVLITAMLVNAAAGLASGLTQTFYSFLFLRFLSGVGVGGSIPVVWSYVAEFQPSSRRGSSLSVIATFWMVGNVSVAGLAWLVIPSEIGWQWGDYKFNSWRVFVMLCALPSFLVAFCLVFFPESPKFLLSKGKDSQALMVFRRMYSINSGGRSRGKFPYSRLTREVVSPHIVEPQSQKFSAMLREAVTKAGQLFRPDLVNVTCIVLAINFTIQFGYYGLWLWFPELFNQLENYYRLHPNVSVSVCEVVGHNVTDGGDLQPSPLSDCGTRGPPDNQVFLNSFIISISAAPANLWTIYHMDKLGRKFFLVFSMLLSGCSAGLIYMVDSAASNLFVSCLFGAVSTMGFNSLDCLSIELFPTSLRGTAMAVTLVSARLGAIIGNIVFGYFVNTHCSLPILSVAVLLIGGGLLGLFLPNTTLQPLL